MTLKSMSELSLKYSSAARKWKRYSFDTVVKIVSIRKAVKTMIFGRTDNLSEGGLGFYAAQQLEINETVQIEFELPSARSAARLSGVVRNKIDGTYGVEFLDLPPGRRKELLRACEDLSSLQGR